MKMDDLSPPAIRKSSESLAERARRFKAMKQTFLQTIRISLTQARDLGRELIEAKEQCQTEGKKWYDWLNDVHLNANRAAEYMRIAKYWTKLVEHPRFDGGTGVHESLIIIAEIELAEGIAARGGPPQGTHILCRSCRIHGKKDNCPECKAIWAKAAASNTKRQEREPGEDDYRSRRRPSNSGKEIFSARDFTKLWRLWYDGFGRIIRATDALAEAKGLKDTPDKLGMERKMEELLKDAQDYYKRVAGMPAPEIMSGGPG